ncbi:hypothetical protein FHS31_000313 [Sphingomonas vulcanisoli]|uniref:PPM-type phosphatase domain-containing protein n=1 Tax=Sphingomonas vulcanisoli TaxID=1658060 RepID=A0ABX0TSY2_9SPHN|nr:protein phosphatase 2C domain-containing protein [Sphingomonas vulcanisoli]NIJ06731.1 hypothetical protein [Sphingomonas vulcanisoli]
MLTVNVAASDYLGGVNEDVVGYSANAAWVIDGATGIGPALLDAPSDAAWLAHAIDGHFRRLLDEDPAMPTRALVRQAILFCRTALDAQALRPAEGPHEHPSAAFAMLRRFDDHIELSGLADCRIVYEDDATATHIFSDRSLDVVEARTLSLVREIVRSEPDLDAESLFQRLLPQLRENRGLMNREGGYWVLGTEPAAADHLACKILPYRPGQRFALASDGFLRLVEMFGLAGPSDLLAIDSEEGWSHWRDRLRDAEREPGSCRRYHRVKVHDDASFLNIEI